MRADVEDALQALAAKFIADVEATTLLRPTCSIGRPRHRLSPHTDDDRVEAILWIGRSGTGACLHYVQFDEDRLEDALVDLADEWSAEVMLGLVETAGVEEARTWPRCPSHDHAMDPVAENGQAWWVCRTDRTVRVLIGELAAP